MDHCRVALQNQTTGARISLGLAGKRLEQNLSATCDYNKHIRMSNKNLMVSHTVFHTATIFRAYGQSSCLLQLTRRRSIETILAQQKTCAAQINARECSAKKSEINESINSSKGSLSTTSQSPL